MMRKGHTEVVVVHERAWGCALSGGSPGIRFIVALYGVQLSKQV
jgi:hypothetical protein